MTRQRKRAKAPNVEPLEQLLKTEDPETYRLVCWYLANRDTERHRAGDVINLGVWEKAGVERKFRLTEESIENIDRCLGMRTCGEASELFMETRQVEPQGECPAGHQNAALEYLTYGIMPTKPCPECGEIPKFGDVCMSLGFGSTHRSNVAGPIAKRAATSSYVSVRDSYARTARSPSSRGYGLGMRVIDHRTTLNLSEYWV